MPDSLKPVLERIVEHIVQTLQAVTTAGSYNQTLTVERPKPALGNRSRDSLAVVVTGNPQKVKDESGDDAYQLVRWLQPFAIVLSVVESEQSETSVDERLNIIRSDVEKKMMEDPHRGGLAIDTYIDEPNYPDPETLHSNVGEVWVLVVVDYRTRVEDPYTQG